MSRRWAAALALVLLAPALPAAALDAEVPAAVIDACIARLDSGVDVGYERIAARCPELAQHLQTSAWGPWLPNGWQDAHNNLSASGLVQLERLAVRERQFLRGARVLEVPQLKPILANLALNKDATTEPGWWGRFKKWLQGLRTTSEADSRDDWLARFVGHISLSQAVIKIVSYIMLGLVVVLASYIVVNEVLTAGVHRRHRVPHGKAVEGADANAQGLSWQDVERAAPADKATVLLLLLAARLAATQRLAAYRALTVRELARGARLADVTDRERLGEVALAAEAHRYSSQMTTNAGLAQVIERGRELFDRLGDPAKASAASEAA